MERDGFTPEDYDHDTTEVWPENWPAWSLFDALGTQWRAGGGGGVIGLDYGPLFTLLDRRYPDDPATWQAHFDDIQILESAALAQIRANA